MPEPSKIYPGFRNMFKQVITYAWKPHEHRIFHFNFAIKEHDFILFSTVRNEPIYFLDRFMKYPHKHFLI